MNPLELPAGPDLDALIATRVMRWIPGEVGRDHPDAGTDGWSYIDSDIEAVGPEPGWSPSTSIEDAWQVVESLRSRGCNVSLFASGRGDRACWCNVDGLGGWLARGDADTMPLAIVRAALAIPAT